MRIGKPVGSRTFHKGHFPEDLRIILATGFKIRHRLLLRAAAHTTRVSGFIRQTQQTFEASANFLAALFIFDHLHDNVLAPRTFEGALVVIRIVRLNCNEPCRLPAAFTAGRCQ